MLAVRFQGEWGRLCLDPQRSGSSPSPPRRKRLLVSAGLPIDLVSPGSSALRMARKQPHQCSGHSVSRPQDLMAH